MCVFHDAIVISNKSLKLKGEDLMREARFWTYMFILLGVASGLSIAGQVRIYFFLFFCFCFSFPDRIGLHADTCLRSFTDVVVDVRHGEADDAPASHGVHQSAPAVGRMVRQQGLESRQPDDQAGQERSGRESGLWILHAYIATHQCTRGRTRLWRVSGGQNLQGPAFFFSGSGLICERKNVSTRRRKPTVKSFWRRPASRPTTVCRLNTFYFFLSIRRRHVSERKPNALTRKQRNSSSPSRRDFEIFFL